jgi:serine protease Do
MHRILWSLIVVLTMAFGFRAMAQEPGYVGVQIRDLTKPESDKFGWEGPRGAVVVRPNDGGPALDAGIVSGDVITTIDGVEITNKDNFIKTIADMEPGRQIRLKIIRDGKEKSLALTLAGRPAYMPVSAGPVEQQLMLDPGGHMAPVWGLTFTPDGR